MAWGGDCGHLGQTTWAFLHKVESRRAAAVLKIFIIHTSDVPDGLGEQTLHYVTDCVRLPSEASQSLRSAFPALFPPGLNILMVLLSRDYFRVETARIWGSLKLLRILWHIFSEQNELWATMGPLQLLCVQQHRCSVWMEHVTKAFT